MNLQEELKALKERIAELEEQAKEEQEFPQEDDKYWCLGSSGEVMNTIYVGFDYEIDRLEFGNIFQTKEQAEFAVEKLRVEAELRKYSRPFKEDEYNYYIFLDTDSDRIDVENRYYFPTQGTIYFESAEKVQQAIEAVGADRIKKYIFGVEG